MQYRREIDGLRALAVVPVMFFHAGFAAFAGGFVGVDVFFVISGYLITSIIVKEMQAGSFTLLNFYERRARRILPALFLVLFVCLPAAWLWLIPPDMRNFSQSLVAVTFFASNILFYFTSGYFGTTAEFRPLLHTWSLSVEEQYYLLFPLFLMLTWHRGQRWIGLSLIGLAALSLALAQWQAKVDPTFAFFLLPTRGWEILLGALTALHLNGSPKWNPEKTIANAGSAIGVAMIAYSVVAFDKTIPFPGVYALVPTIGTALVILFASPDTAVGKVLGLRWIVGLGLVSYSAYLWHQPLFAFARHRSIDEPSKALMAALIVTSVVLAFLSWKVVELPFRDRRRFSRKQVFTAGAWCSAVFIVLGLVGKFGGGFESRLDAEQRKIAAFSDYDFAKGIRRYSCYLEPENTFANFAPDCAITQPGAPTLVIWGDSYAAALTPGVRAIQNNVIQYTASKCPPVIDVVYADRPNCLGINAFVLQQIGRLKPDRVLLHANWHVYDRDSTLRNLRLTIEGIHRLSPATNTVVVGGVPQWRRTLPILGIKSHLTLDREQRMAMPSYAELAGLDLEIAQVAAQSQAGFVSALNQLCTGGDCLVVIEHQGRFELTAWDNGHLTESAALLLAAKLFAERPLRASP